jgi:hypothetical protein
MRCPDCGKFVPFDTEVDPEESGEPEFDGSEFTATYTRTLTCGECSTELKSAEIEVAVSAEIIPPEPEEIAELATKKPPLKSDLDDEGEDEEEDAEEETEEHEHEWTVEATASPTMRSITKDRHGKPITKARYIKTEYGVEVEFEASCECGATAKASAEEYVSASGMDELV